MKRMFFPVTVIIAVVSVGLYGCGRSAQTEPEASNTPSATDEHEDHMEHGDHDHGDHAHHDDDGKSDMEKMKAELAKLSPEDAASALKQHTCPVTGEMLGTMGAPEKVDVKGQQVWICCDGCKDKLLDNPDKYLAKLKRE